MTNLFQAKENGKEHAEQGRGVHNRGKREGVLLDHRRVEGRTGTKPFRQSHSRIREPATEDGTQDAGDVEAHGQDEESPRLILALDGDLGDHGADDAHKAVDAAREHAPKHGRSEGGGETITEAGDSSTQRADQEDHLATTVELGRVGNLAPKDGSQDLSAGKTAGEKTGLRGYLRIRQHRF